MNIFRQLKSIIRNLRLSKTLVVYGDGKATFAKEQRGATGSDMTGSGIDRKSPELEVTLEVTEGHVTPTAFPWVRPCPTGSCAISTLVGPSHR